MAKKKDFGAFLERFLSHVIDCDAAKSTYLLTKNLVWCNSESLWLASCGPWWKQLIRVLIILAVCRFQVFGGLFWFQ